jgi:pimeloyl-ACP methyl ester carboxylesterase
LVATSGTDYVLAIDAWKKEDMDPRPEQPGIYKIEKVPLLNEQSTRLGDGSCEQEADCFVLHYFTADRFDPANQQKKNILFIPGGPGQFVGEKESASMALKFLAEGGVENINDGRNNVVYFHVRGTGQSLVATDNSFDRFLRARYVIHDIEKLRNELLGDKPWDAIYAHSWGTLVAQMYAEEYGSPDKRKVRSLILSAPITRSRPETLRFRTRQTSANLESIYRFHKPDGECSCVEPSYLSDRIADFQANKAAFDASDNLCFLADHVGPITKTVEDILDKLGDDYGSLDFVTENFDALKNEQDFRAGGRFPFPLEFFSALRRVQMSGAPVDAKPLVFASDSKSLISAALLIASYLVAPNPIAAGAQCDIDSRFPNISGGSCGNRICQRLEAMGSQSFSGGGLESVRASYVYGVYDGVARWVFNMLDKECFTGQDLGAFAHAEASSSDKKKFLRKAAKRIGLVSDEVVCGWDPGKHRHAVPTLILKGSADAIIAGCQAEHFYNEGLAGPRVLLKLRGMGHLMSVAQQRVFAKPSRETTAFADLVEQFIKTPVASLTEAMLDKMQIIRAEEVKPGPDGKIDLGHCQTTPDE